MQKTKEKHFGTIGGSVKKNLSTLREGGTALHSGLTCTLWIVLH